MARRNSRRRRRRSYGVLYKIISVLVICAVIVAALTMFFKVRTITVTGDTQYGEEEIISASGVKTGDNLFLLNKYAIAESMLKELPALAQSLSGPLSRLEGRLLALSGRLPDGIGSGLRAGVTNFFESGALMGGKLYEWLFTFASGFLKKLPRVLLYDRAAGCRLARGSVPTARFNAEN